MKAQHYLEQLDHLETVIQNKEVEKEQWRDIAEGMTARYDGERVQSSGSQQKMSDAVNKIADICSEIDEIKCDLVEKRKEIISMIEKLKPKEYKVLHMLYIQNKSFKEVAAECGKSHSWATSVHGIALKNLQKILDDHEQKAKIYKII